MVALAPMLAPPGSLPSKTELLLPGPLPPEAREVRRWTRETATGRPTALVLTRGLGPTGEAMGLHTDYIDGRGFRWRTRGVLIPVGVWTELAETIAAALP
jgi:hypothetical protein